MTSNKTNENFVIPFGKHKGKTIKELLIYKTGDIDYLKWLMNNNILRLEMSHALKEKIYKADYNQPYISNSGGGDMMTGYSSEGYM